MATVDPVFVSYFTPDYSGVASRLRASLEKYKLRHDIQTMKPKGSWQANTHTKPSFILGRLGAHSSRPVVWVDADAVISSPPEIFLKPWQKDAYVCRWARPDKNQRWEVLSGTIGFNQTEAAYRLVSRWSDLCWENPEVWDQKLLARAIEDTPRMGTRWLPPEYCWIHDRFPVAFAGRNKTPVITHYQASREARKGQIPGAKT